MPALRTDIGVGHDDHDVGVGGQQLDEGGEARVPHLHRLELRCRFAATQLELLDDVADLLEAMLIAVFDAGGARDDEEGGALKDDDLLGVSEWRWPCNAAR